MVSRPRNHCQIQYHIDFFVFCQVFYNFSSWMYVFYPLGLTCEYTVRKWSRLTLLWVEVQFSQHLWWKDTLSCRWMVWPVTAITRCCRRVHFRLSLHHPTRASLHSSPSAAPRVRLEAGTTLFGLLQLCPKFWSQEVWGLQRCSLARLFWLFRVSL